jgi:hypothetical protein
MKSLSTLQLSRYLLVTKRTVQRQAIKGNWQYEECYGLGGVRRMYTFSALPNEVQLKVIASIIAHHETYNMNSQELLTEQEHPFVVLFGHDPCNWLNQHCFAHGVDKSLLNLAYVKLGLLTLARLFADECNMGKIKGFDIFCQKYNGKELKLESAVYGVVRHISRITLLRWEKKEYAMAKGEVVATPVNPSTGYAELRIVADEVFMVAPNMTAKKLRGYFLTFFSDRRIPHEREIELWLGER